MNRLVGGGVVGFLLGALFILVLARQSSDVFMRNRTAAVPHELSAEAQRLFHAGDLKGAMMMLRAQSGATILASVDSLTVQKWDLAYPISAWLAGAITSGMKPSGDLGLAMDLATVDAQIAIVMERDGSAEEAQQLLERAARSAGTDPEHLRLAAQAALGI